MRIWKPMADGTGVESFEVEPIKGFTGLYLHKDNYIVGYKTKKAALQKVIDDLARQIMDIESVRDRLCYELQEL